MFDESAAVNFTYPWRDNFCEQRDFLVGQCPGGYGHQGEDIRPAQCVLYNAEADRCLPYQDYVAAVHDGVIRRMPGNLGAYIVVNTENEHVRFRYLHMNPKFMDADGLLNGRQVSEGEIIGKVATWGDFEQGTSYHLHFNIQVFTSVGWVWVNPYMTLVAAYERLVGGRGTEIKPGEPAPPVPVKLPVILHPTPPAEPLAASASPPATPEASSTPPAKLEEAAAERAKPQPAPPYQSPAPAKSDELTGAFAVSRRARSGCRPIVCAAVMTTMPHAANPPAKRPAPAFTPDPARLPFRRARCRREPRVRRTSVWRAVARLRPLGCRRSAPARSGAAFRKRPMTA